MRIKFNKILAVAVFMGLAGCSSDGANRGNTYETGANGEADAEDIGTPLTVSKEAMDEAEKIVSGFTNLKVSHDTQGASAEFDDISGRHYRFEFDFGVNAEGLLDPARTADELPGSDALAPNKRLKYDSEWHWWGVKYRLNRGETRDLVTEGNNAAVLYAIGAAFGCGACAVGAAIEANWAGQANRFYNEGDCIHLNLPYFTTGRTKRNTYNCR